MANPNTAFRYASKTELVKREAHTTSLAAALAVDRLKAEYPGCTVRTTRRGTRNRFTGLRVTTHTVSVYRRPQQ